MRGATLGMALLLALAAQGSEGKLSPGVVYSGLATRRASGHHTHAAGHHALHQAKHTAKLASKHVVPVVPVEDNYDAAQSADEMITKALEHGVLSAAQAKAITAAAKVAAEADTEKVAAARKIIEAAKEAEAAVADEAAAANTAAAEAAKSVTEDEKKLHEDEEKAAVPAAMAHEKQAALNSANQRLAAAMAYGATQTRNMDRALAAEQAAESAATARAALIKAKAETDSAAIAARNLADVSGTYSGPPIAEDDEPPAPRVGRKPDPGVSEKVGIVIFFILLVGAIIFWWFAFGRSSGSGEAAQGMARPSDYGATGSYASQYQQDTSV